MADNNELKLHKVKVDGLYGYADKDDNIVIPCQWRDAEDFSEGLAAVKSENDQWGFIDETGVEVIQCKCFLAIPFKEGMARVINESIQYGYIDKSGKEIIPCQWKFAEDFSNNATALVEDNSGNRFVIDKSGNVIEEYKRANSSENLVTEDTEDNNKVNNNPREWYDIYPYKEGLARVVDFNSKYGFIDENGNVAIPCEWKYAENFHEGLAYVANADGDHGYIDKSGKETVPCRWKKITHFNNGFAKAENYGGWGLIDKKGNEIIPCQWKEIISYDDQSVEVEDENGTRFTIYYSGNILPHVKNGVDLYPLKRDDKYGYINKKGETVIPHTWYAAGYFNNGYAVVGDGDYFNCRYGLIDEKGSIIIPCKWKALEPITKKLIKVAGDYWDYGLIDIEGNVLVPCNWDYIESFSNGLAQVKDCQDHYGFVDKKGNLAILCQWKSAERFRNSKAKVCDWKGREFYIDKSGNIIEDVTPEDVKKRLKKQDAQREKAEAKKQKLLAPKLSMLSEYEDKYGVRAQFICVRNYVSSKSLFVVSAIHNQVVSFDATGSFDRNYYDRAMQFVLYLNELTITYGKSKVQRREKLPEVAQKALETKLKELGLEYAWYGIYNESQRRYLSGKYKVTAATWMK